MESFFPFTLILFIVAVILILQSVKIVPQKQAWIVERLGKYHRTLHAGLHLIIPLIDTIRAKVSLKEQVLDIPKQEVITKDNVVVKIDAVCYFTVIKPEDAVYNIENLEYAIIQTIQTNLRDIIGGMELDEILSSREKINAKIKEVLQGAASSWGILINRVEVKEIEPPANIVQAMSMLIEADRKKKAMITEAEGKKRAQVLEAEGYKLAKWQEAEAIERIGQAQAHAINSVKSAVGDGETAGKLILGDSFIKSLEKLSNSPNSKIVLLPPSVESLTEILRKKNES
ncbi:regulator of protease activity HflC (stomatin/prohibitin superfamily) [Thermovibrio guaymasensis]|uniref:Regulator of protease activity HflC (Stomatin/prohibitin superfamily) n=1 Tax=Thermovibrio guaymasensis TaxID=240167 RepID=A0A420W7U1_9BACT|nr:SPFH domain-containing protein [Thermovibrio guaymasensis]RKQ63345.1 regulator of protease activity HflC (stomatin/prohibitin superfamily) [Thermovibrio guaymasensis]